MVWPHFNIASADRALDKPCWRRAWYYRNVSFRNAYATSSLCVSEWPSSLCGERQNPSSCMEHSYGPSYKRDSITWLPAAAGHHAHTQEGPCSPPCAWGVLILQVLIWSQGLPSCAFSACCGAPRCFLITLGKSARPSALEDLGVCRAKLLVVVGTCRPGSMQAGYRRAVSPPLAFGSREKPLLLHRETQLGFPLPIGTADK